MLIYLYKILVFLWKDDIPITSFITYIVKYLGYAIMFIPLSDN